MVHTQWLANGLDTAGSAPKTVGRMGPIVLMNERERPHVSTHLQARFVTDDGWFPSERPDLLLSSERRCKDTKRT